MKVFEEVSEEPHDSIPAESVVNFDELYLVASNDEQFVEEMLRRLLVSFEEGIAKIHKAIEEGNLTQIG